MRNLRSAGTPYDLFRMKGKRERRRRRRKQDMKQTRTTCSLVLERQPGVCKALGSITERERGRWEGGTREGEREKGASQN